LGGGFEDSAGEGKAELERKEKDEIAKKKAKRDRMQAEYEEYLWRNKKRNEKFAPFVDGPRICSSFSLPV
jgi:hypothetical protein